MTQYKDKKKSAETATLGLFSYPVMMAADILLYKATAVPVGDDQHQHLELARTIARKFNTTYGCGEDLLPSPHPIRLDGVGRVMSLRDATRKMSKSDPSKYGCIYLADSEDDIAAKVRKAKTCERGVQNLVSIIAALEGISKDEISTESAAALKSRAIDALVESVAPIGREAARIEADVEHRLDIKSWERACS